MLIIFLYGVMHFGYGQKMHYIQQLYVNNLTNITRYTWCDDSMLSDIVYVASDSFSILSFDITQDGKHILLSEGIPYYTVGYEIVDPDEAYYGIERTNLIWANMESRAIRVIDTIGGPYGEGARWVAHVCLASTDSFFYALVGGWEWNSIRFYAFPDVVQLPDISIVGDGVTPICWSENGKSFYAHYFYHGEPGRANANVVRFDLVELRSEVLEKPLDSLLAPHIFLSQGVAPTETERKKRRGIWSPDGSKIAALESGAIVEKDVESEEQTAVLPYEPVPLYKYMPAKDTIRVIWK